MGPSHTGRGQIENQDAKPFAPLVVVCPPGGAPPRFSSRLRLSQIAGLITDTAKVLHEFIRGSGGAYTIFNLPPGASQAWVNMNDAGQVAGSFFGSDSIFHGFLRDTNGTLTVFSMPGTKTYVNDINQGGFIVGQYGSRTGRHQGFLRRPDGTTVTLIYPGATGITSTTSADCMNQAGTIAGHYQINTSTNTEVHRFIVTGVH
jgi:hypothetical protein